MVAKGVKSAEWALRIGIAGEFIGHGAFALSVKQGWIAFFTTLGLSEGFATSALPLIGALDLLVALLVLVKPYKLVLGWATLWGFWTALLRPIAGEPVWDFVERFTNWAAPLALLYLRRFPKSLKEWFE